MELDSISTKQSKNLNWKTVRDEVKQRTGQATVPQLFFNGRHLGGNSDFKSLSNSEREELINWVRENWPGWRNTSTASRASSSNDENQNDSFVCEPDEEAELAKKLAESKVPQKRLKGLKSYRAAFTGKQLNEWLKSQGLGEEKAESLLQANFIRPIKPINTILNSELYQMTEHVNVRALNAGSMPPCKAPSPGELSELLRKQIKLTGINLL